MMPLRNQREYISVFYNEEDKPFTRYPDLLARYLVKRYKLSVGKKMLDLGCGRGDFLRGFLRCGINGYGVDRSKIAKSICPEAKITLSDLGNESLPYKDNSFDLVFSKSVLEHFYYPEELVQEIYRILKPNGLVITMVPDWESGYKKTFYDDYTHRTPFTLASLRNIFIANGFNDVKVEKFRQLPFLWTMPWLQPFTMFVALITPGFMREYSKLVMFSKGVMLLSSAIKS
jgi:SAM-dependent methyltransferase|tara:strand:+ start:335 stop:1024 length:690 start_codon:yes stop_codon:yes gene_type:complete